MEREIACVCLCVFGEEREREGERDTHRDYPSVNL
jgi:hypothetical protein